MKKTFYRSLLPLLLIVVLLCSVSCGLDLRSRQEKPFYSLEDLPAYAGEPYVEVNGNTPYFTDAEKTAARKSYETYGELDSLGRCTTCVASVGKDLMPTEARGSLRSVTPTGWPEKEEDAKYDIVDGKYLYNRCHLIGFQLTSENANRKNLITGTRYLNVDGMLPFENMVADYVKETENHVLYRVTPIFDGNDLVALGVLMEGYSIEDGGDGILFCVFCYNVQPGIVIDYANGNSRLAEKGEALMPAWNDREDTNPDQTDLQDLVPDWKHDDRQTSLTLLQGSEDVVQGEKATVTVQGKPGTVYSIRVKLPSGKESTASALTEKTADEQGKVTWEWTIASNTKPGTAIVTVTGSEGESLQVSFSILSKPAEE